MANRNPRRAPEVTDATINYVQCDGLVSKKQLFNSLSISVI